MRRYCDSGFWRCDALGGFGGAGVWRCWDTLGLFREIAREGWHFRLLSPLIPSTYTRSCRAGYEELLFGSERILNDRERDRGNSRSAPPCHARTCPSVVGSPAKVKSPDARAPLGKNMKKSSTLQTLLEDMMISKTIRGFYMCKHFVILFNALWRCRRCGAGCLLDAASCRRRKGKASRTKARAKMPLDFFKFQPRSSRPRRLDLDPSPGRATRVARPDLRIPALRRHSEGVMRETGQVQSL